MSAPMPFGRHDTACTTIVVTRGPPRFDWDDANAGHIARHDVEPEEVEEALLDPRCIPAVAYAVPGERRRAVIGATEVGRVLFVAYTTRRVSIRVVTARDADRDERRAYRARRR